jgi:hypothetical protein
MYDFNVVYCNMGEEGETVGGTITNVLEDYSLKGYYPGRDRIPGRNIMMDFYRVLQMSKYTILVIDEEFLEEPWPEHLGETTMGYLAVKGFSMTNIDKLIVIYIGVTEDHVARRFPQFNIRNTVYFPSATLRECDKNVIGRLALGMRGFTDVYDALAQLEEEKPSQGGHE